MAEVVPYVLLAGLVVLAVLYALHHGAINKLKAGVSSLESAAVNDAKNLETAVANAVKAEYNKVATSVQSDVSTLKQDLTDLKNKVKL